MDMEEEGDRPEMLSAMYLHTSETQSQLHVGA